MKKQPVKLAYNAIILITLIIVHISSLDISKKESKEASGQNTKSTTKDNKKKKSTEASKLFRKTVLTTSCNNDRNFDNHECDIVSPGPICTFNGDKIILPKKVPRGLVGYWNFDEIRVLDSSGNRNHAKNVVKPGPSMSSQGASGLFSDGDFISIPYTDDFNTSKYTITFWIFMIKDYSTQDKGIRYCPIIQRGKDDLFSKVFKRSPALYYDRIKRNLKLFINTKDNNEPQGENITSNSLINHQRWMHISLVKSGNTVKLYVNGILDNHFTLKGGSISNNKGELYIGNTPWLKDSCRYPFLIDELRYYNVDISAEAIQAEASPVLGGLDPTFITLGGMNLDIKEAGNSCSDGYHICTSIELHTGGYQVARSMGWLDWNTHIWSHGALKSPKDFIGMKGLSVCCSDLR